ncbi:coiled-coil domain-containing protein 24 isoform X2 [Bufo gargarizans]|uniref:coiled-coil domain-containing protein 24 isoform X2 n=1 Tax=Bufo gargarizans TaxID=30331 RepID=UPI001CF3C386|nr:coiled-coil domain-containing protein 24 isoform X2 [Bufo gargarizans]
MLQPTSDQDSGYGEFLESPPSLWSLVEEQVPRSERAEIKRILGDAAVDLSLDLHAEVEVLLELWRDARSSCPSAVQSSPSSGSILADPPLIKDMVTQEIRMLLLSVRTKARHHGLDEDQAVSKYNPRVVSFVIGTAGRPESRARSSESRWSRPPSGCRAVSERSFSSLSTSSSIEDDLEELKDKLQISHIDEVILHLRSLLEDECRTLEADVITLQRRLEVEWQYAEALQAEPSLTELKEERRILERDLQLDQLPAPKMASSGKPNIVRLLDMGRRRQNAGCILSLKMSSTPDLQSDRPLTPCPPDPRLKTPQGRTVRRDLAGPGALSCAAAYPVTAPEEPGLSSPHRFIQERTARVYSPLGRGTVRPPSLPANGTAPFTYEAPAPPGNTLLVPLPPKVRRPPGSSGPAPAFRRVRAHVMNLPP